MSETVYLFYPGHLGPKPVTELPGRRGILWDRDVKAVPASAAASMVAESGFQRCLDLGEASAVLGRSKKKLKELIDAGDLQSAIYTPAREGAADVVVIVLPRGVNVGALKRRLDANPITSGDPSGEPAKEA